MISGVKFRTIRDKVIRQVLLPLGYQKANQLLVYHCSPRIFAIKFQGSRYGGEYIVNCSFHYDYIPGSRSGMLFSEGKFDSEDFAFNCRLGQALYGREIWFPYGKNEIVSEKTIRKVINDSQQVSKEFEKRFGNGKVFLELISANHLLRRFEWVDYRNKTFCDNKLSEEEMERILKKKYGEYSEEFVPVSDLYQKWGFDVPDMTAFMIQLANFFNKKKLAREYAEIAIKSPLTKRFPAILKQLKQLKGSI